MEAVLLDPRVHADNDMTTDEVCHTIVKPATSPPGYWVRVTPRQEARGTAYAPTYIHAESGTEHSKPPPGTA